MAPVYFQELLDFYIPCRILRSGNMQLTSEDTIVQFKIVRVQGIFCMCLPALGCPTTGTKDVRFRR